MKKEEYDVIIVGAGVSGLRLASLLDKIKLRVLLLERKPTICIEPSSFGTFTYIAKEHGLEPFIEYYFDKWAFYGPSIKAVRAQNKVMCLVNYAKWAASLKFKKVEMKTGVDIAKAQRVNSGILLADRDKNCYFGRLVVDSSGFAQIVQRLLGLKTNKETGLSYEVELDGCAIPVKKEASFILNFKVSNSGGWLYALSRKKAQFGWADFYPESKSNLAYLKKRVHHAIKTIAPQNSWLKNSKITYSYGRFGPSGKMNHKVYDNLIAIGDAGGCGTPATLEGFREAMDSAKMAYLTIRQTKNYSKDELHYFLDLFREKYGKYYRMHKILRYIYLNWARNEDIDRWISNFNTVNKTDFFHLIKGEHTPYLMIKTLDASLVFNILLNAINNVLPLFIRFRPHISASKKEITNAKN